MSKWYLRLLYLFLLLFNWKIIRIKSKKREKYPRISKNRIAIKLLTTILLMAISFIIYNITGYPIPIVFGYIYKLASDAMGNSNLGSQIYPSVVEYNEKTYSVWQGDSDFDPWIAVFTHSNNSWSAAVKVAINPLTANAHGAPAVVVDNNGFIHVFYGCHGTVLKHAKSDSAEDISAWTVQGNMGSGATYPTVVTDGDNMYVFYRKGISSTGTIVYQKSPDNGANWGGQTTVIDFYTDDTLALYHGNIALDSTNGRIHIGWVLRTGDTVRSNVYHAYFKTSDSTMYAMDGTDLGSTIIKSEADANCLIYDSSGRWTQMPALHLDSDGTPYLIYYKEDVGDKDFDFAKWGGSSWDIETITNTGAISGGYDFIINSSSDIEAYLGIYNGAGTKRDCVKWIYDGSWSEDFVILSQDVTGDVVGSPKCAVNYTQKFKMIVGTINDTLTVTTGRIFAYLTNYVITSNEDFNMGTTSGSFGYNGALHLDTSKSEVNSDFNNNHTDWSTNSPMTAEDNPLFVRLYSEFFRYFEYDNAITPSTVLNWRFRCTMPQTNKGVSFYLNADYASAVDRVIVAFKDDGTLELQKEKDDEGTQVLYSFGSYQKDTWYEVVVIFSATTIYFYVNGDSKYSNEATDLPIADLTVAYVGINGYVDLDYFYVGPYATSNSQKSQPIPVPTDQKISTLAVGYSGISATYTITIKILDASDDSVLWTGDAITSGESITYDTSDFGDITVDFKVETIEAGDGDDTPDVTIINGEFEDAGQSSQVLGPVVILKGTGGGPS